MPTIATTFCKYHPYSHHLLFRYVLGCKGNNRQQCVQSRGMRASGMKVVHVVTVSCTNFQLQSLLSDRLQPLGSSEDTRIQVSASHTVNMNRAGLQHTGPF